MSDIVIFTAEGESGDKSASRTSLTRRAYVRTDLVKNIHTVLAVSGVPAIGADHPSLEDAKVRHLYPRSLGNGFEWEIVVQYELVSPGGGAITLSSPTIPNAVPTSEPWELSQDYLEVPHPPESLLETASAGGVAGAAANPSMNTAGDTFGSPVIEPLYLTVLILEKNMLDADTSIAAAAGFQGSTNSAQVVVAGITIPIRCGLMRRCAVQRRYFGSAATPYWRFRAEVVVYPAATTSDFAVLQQGFNKKATPPATGVEPIYKDGVALRVPTHLDAAGAPSLTPLWRYFIRSKVVAWAGLLPTAV